MAIDWAAAEGWNPGLDDLAAFHATDPSGFLMGFIGDRPVSSISVVRYGDDFGFLGFNILAPDDRGQGMGLATWTAGMARLEGRTVGLDGVVAKQANCSKSELVLAGNNLRHTGTVSFDRTGKGGRPRGRERCRRSKATTGGIFPPPGALRLQLAVARRRQLRLRARAAE